MNISFSGKANIARIDHDKLCSRFDRVADLHANNRMGFLWVRTNQHDYISVPSDVGNGIGHSARTQGLCQTGNRRAMTNAGAIIDVVRLEHRTCHFLKHVDIFIGRASTRKRSKGLTAKLITQCTHLSCNKIKGFIPCSGLKLPCFAVADKGRSKTFLRMNEIEATAAALYTQQTMI